MPKTRVQWATDLREQARVAREEAERVIGTADSRVFSSYASVCTDFAQLLDVMEELDAHAPRPPALKT